MKHMANMLAIAAMLLLVIPGGSAHAFKIKTHVWIAQQVIDDLQQGCTSLTPATGGSCLTVEVNGVSREFLVDAGTTKAILENQAVYRMGHIGPDASPDILAGQIVIHPGSQGGVNERSTDVWAYDLERFITTLENRVSTEDYYAYKESQCEKKDYNLDKIWKLINSMSSDSSDLDWSRYSDVFDAIADSIKDDVVNGLPTATAVNPREVAYHRGMLGHIAAMFLRILMSIITPAMFFP